ncbi:MAG: GDSL-type esterase/lipase family protein [Puniceicoccales bacterium]
MTSTILRKATCLLALAALSPMAGFGANETYPIRKPEEFIQRDGLPNFFHKIEQNQPVTIAYLGGSITAQKGWRVLSQKWLEDTFPDSSFNGVHAAIGGTGSELGVFRVEADALSTEPDLLFVEFAVNDYRGNPEDTLRAMEGIVRKTWQKSPETDICFVYTLTSRESKEVANGKAKQSTSVMEAVADHYGIPSIHLGLKAAQMEKEGTLLMKTNAPITRVSGDELNEAASLARDESGRIIFSKDGIHPYPETGHVLYTEALIRSMTQMQDLAEEAPHQLPAPIREDNWEDAKQIPLSSSMLSGPVELLSQSDNAVAKRFKNRMPQLFMLTPGAELRFKFKGTKVGIYDLLGPDAAMLEVTIDGQTTKKPRMDGYCTYHRLSTLDIGKDLEDTAHEVSIRVLDETFDKEQKLFERNRHDFEKSPEKYADHRWYAGSILIVGELVE